ncbi:lipopolysaccharide biosynthesis protein [Methylocaldum sp.]|uniref:lipopolysaccharide biosynthesis protein n=1 Tax=Methylocaldum sp. TaxID=1969727 RepID=UPI00321FD2BF
MSSSPSVRRSLAWSLLQRYVAFLIGIGTTIIISRLLTPAEIGIYSLCAAIVAIAHVMRDFGIGEYIIQEKDLNRSRLKAAFALAILTAWTAAVLLLLLRGIVADFYDEPGLRAVLSVLALNFILLPFGTPAFALLSRELAFDRIFVITTVGTAVQSICAVSLAALGFSYMSLAWASVASSLSIFLLCTYFRPGDSWILPSLRGIDRVWRYGLAAAGSNVLINIGHQAHEFIIGRSFGFHDLGIFNRGSGLLMQFNTNIHHAIIRVATPTFAAHHRLGGSLADHYTRGVSLYTSIAWPFFSFAAVMALPIMRLFFGLQWDEAAPIARLLAVGFFIGAVSAIAPSLLAATGNVRANLRIQSFLMPLRVVVVLGAAFIGLKAVAAGISLLSLVGLALYTSQVSRIAGVPFAHILGATRKSAVVTVVTMLPASLFLLLAGPALDSNPWLVLVAALLTGLAWLVAVFVLRHEVGDEVRRAMGSLRRLAGNATGRIK